MICFRDMTFCSAPCATHSCFRKFNAEQEAAALRWWGEPGPPIAFGDLSHGCADYTPDQPETEATP